MGKEINGKGLITNGNINPSLSLDELLQFDLPEKRTAIHYLQVNAQYQHNYNEIDKDVFESLPYMYTYEQITKTFSEPEVDEALKAAYTRLSAHIQLLKTKTEEYHYKLGKEIYEATEKLKFNGELELSKGQLLGFITGIGNWNDFNVGKVSEAIEYLHENAPRMNCGVNNCNTGLLNHKWSIQSDYIFMNFGFNYEPAVKEIEQWFKSVSHVRTMSNADSFHLQVDDVAGGGFYVRVVLWWD